MFQIMMIKKVLSCFLCFSTVYGSSNKRSENEDEEDMSEIFGGEERIWGVLGPFYANDLVLCGELDDVLKVMVRRFVEVCKRRSVKVNANRCKVMVLRGKEVSLY